MSRVAVASWRSAAIVLVLAVACLAGFVRLAVWSATKQVSFDGAMNLEVARSLAEGQGYERMYAGRSGFSHEIQSRAPFILPAAAIFGAFGVGVWQAQLTNLLYVAALAIVVLALLRRHASWQWGLAAVALCLWIPGLREIAMNGYGEVPALAWWLAAVLVLSVDGDRTSGFGRLFAAGVLAGIAVLTKTVLAIGLVALVPLLLSRIAACRGSRARFAIGAIAALAAGVVLPALAYELAHVAALGDLARWRTWVSDEVHAIHMQAGTTAGFKDTHGVGSKVVVHAHVLAANTGIPLALLPFWIAGPIALAMLGRRWVSGANARAALLALAVFAAIYFAWWLGFTPTAKAWYRRIFNGVLVLEVLLVALLAAAWMARARASKSKLALAACVALVALQVPLVAGTLAGSDAEQFGGTDTLREDLAAVARVPADETIFAAGWYSAPVLALYSGRRFDDIADQAPADLAASSPAYLALDMQALAMGAGTYWIDRYAHRDLASTPTLRLVEIDAKTPRNPFEGVAVDAAAVKGYVNFHDGEYPYLFGFQNREGDGWRWAMADSETLLRYRGEAEFAVDVYIPPLKGYIWRRPIGITVWLDGCRLGTFRQDENRRERWWFPVRNCPLKSESIVAARLTGDNLYDSRDDRQLGYIIHALGFAEPMPPGGEAQR
ncbi:MAG TPA: hypothetical protein VKB52_06205 [Rhodanobacteraceae bacterium]|nr:hypothetical protein [Rhodanobacteraceae bacterium]